MIEQLSFVYLSDFIRHALDISFFLNAIVESWK